MTDAATRPLLAGRGLAKAFRAPRTALWGGTRREVRAVSGVSFDLHAGETLALVGESGSGKSTTARLVLRLLSPDAGEIELDGRSWLDLPLAQLNRARRDVGVVFQDPGSSLDPRMTVGAIVAEPLAAPASFPAASASGSPSPARSPPSRSSSSSTSPSRRSTFRSGPRS